MDEEGKKGICVDECDCKCNDISHDCCAKKEVSDTDVDPETGLKTDDDDIAV